jgi:hypothetical protein
VNAIDFDKITKSDFDEMEGGRLVAPGKYSATLFSQQNNKIDQLTDSIIFNVVPIQKGALDGATPEESSKFWADYYDTRSKYGALSMTLKNAIKKINAMQLAAARSNSELGGIDMELENLRQDLLAIEVEMYGNKAKQLIGERTIFTINSRLYRVASGFSRSTYGPTDNHLNSLEVVKNQLNDIKPRLEEHLVKMDRLSNELVKLGAPWVEGSDLWKD